MSAVDVQRARRDTPGCDHVVHLDNAGASLMPEPVLRATVEHLELEARIGGYQAADARESAWRHTYDALARLVNCRREEIAVVENATRGWDMAFYAIAFRPGDRILTSMAEYGSNYLAYLQVRLEPPFVDVLAAHWDDEHSYSLRDDARRFETWETNYATKIALGVAADYALELGLDAVKECDYRLAASLRRGLEEIDGVDVLDLGRERCAIVSFAVHDQNSDDVKTALARRRINVSVSMVEDTLLDMRQRGYDEWLRASVHYFNTDAEVDELVDAVAAVRA